MTMPLEYAPAKLSRASCRVSMIILAIGFLTVMVVGVILSYLTFKSLWSVPPGTPIRPMALAALDFLGGAGALLLSGLLALVAVIVGWRWKRVWALAILLCAFGLAPYFASQVTWGWICDAHHLEMEP